MKQTLTQVLFYHTRTLTVGVVNSHITEQLLKESECALAPSTS